MPERIAFTKAALGDLIDRLAGRRIVVHDARQPGLIAELRPGGTLSFYLYRWSNGRPHRIRIGPFPVVTVEQAREQAKLLLADLTKGIDPQELKRGRREEPTLQKLFDHWLEAHAKEHKRTWLEDQRQFDRLLVGWHTRRLSTIKKSDVQALHTRIGKANGHYAANRLLALVRALFNRATDIGFDGANPTKGVKKYKEESRDRFLQPEELPMFMVAVEAEPNETIRDFFLLCLYTGARKSNVASMRWADLDLRGGKWRIPKTKSGEPHTLPLSPPAIEILTKRKAASVKGCEWVLPAQKEKSKPHLGSPKDAWKRLCTRAGLSDLRIHDLRRTLGSYQAAAGASLAVIGKSLGHKPGSPATAVYGRLHLDPVRASIDVAVAAIVKAGAKGDDDDAN